MSNLFVMAPVLLMVVMLYFVTRADKKKRSTLEASLNKGDRVVTRAGFVGKIISLEGKHARVEIAPGVVVTVVKTAIEGREGADEPAKPDAKSATPKSDAPASAVAESGSKKK